MIVIIIAILLQWMFKWVFRAEQIMLAFHFKTQIQQCNKINKTRSGQINQHTNKEDTKKQSPTKLKMLNKWNFTEKITNIIGEKFSKEATLTPLEGMWLANLIFLPIAIFLSYKTSKGIIIFDSSIYTNPFRKLFTRQWKFYKYVASPLSLKKMDMR